MGPLEQRLRSKIISGLSPAHFEIQNESHSHSGPKAPTNQPETHFRAVVVATSFETLSRLERQRRVLEIVADEMRAGVHALTMRCLTPSEWAEGGGESFISPDCHGGSKR